MSEALITIFLRTNILAQQKLLNGVLLRRSCLIIPPKEGSNVCLNVTLLRTILSPTQIFFSDTQNSRISVRQSSPWCRSVCLSVCSTPSRGSPDRKKCFSLLLFGTEKTFCHWPLLLLQRGLNTRRTKHRLSNLLSSHPPSQLVQRARERTP